MNVPSLVYHHPHVCVLRDEISELTETERRGLSVIHSLVDAAKQSGYAIKCDDGVYSFTISGLCVEWFVYERSTQHRVPLTRKEAESKLCTAVEMREGKLTFRPSGLLVLIARVDGRGEETVTESHQRHFDPAVIFRRFEIMATKAIAEKQASEEVEQRARKRAIDRERSREIESRRWNAVSSAMRAMEKADRLRRFVDRITSHSPMRPDQEHRVRKWARWVLAYADAIDPMTKNFDVVLEQLGLPRR